MLREAVTRETQKAARGDETDPRVRKMAAHSFPLEGRNDRSRRKIGRRGKYQYPSCLPCRHASSKNTRSNLLPPQACAPESICISAFRRGGEWVREGCTPTSGRGDDKKAAELKEESAEDATTHAHTTVHRVVALDKRVGGEYNNAGVPIASSRGIVSSATGRCVKHPRDGRSKIWTINNEPLHVETLPPIENPVDMEERNYSSSWWSIFFL